MQPNDAMSWRIKTSLLLVALGTGFTLWCLVRTTALSMTLFFTLGLPVYGLAAILYVTDVLLDLRRHRVL
jgi:hypothetical protein